MDFFDMDFSELFKNKHGDNIYNKICDLIKNENDNKYSVQIIFKVAFLDYFGFKNSEIETLMKNTKPTYNVNVSDIKNIHSKSIKKIIKYLESKNQTK